MGSIGIRHLSKSYGAVRALDDVSLDVRAGELFFLLGASGCGKSTLLRCIAGLEVPDSGAVHFDGRDVTPLPPHKRGAAMVFQSYALWPHLTVAQNIAFGLEERKIPRTEIRRRVDEALEMMRLGGFGERGIDQMSGGQQQRVALARALVVRPQCLLLDEPLSNLDARLRVEMRREIRRIVKENSLTAVYVTHDQEEALATADRMAIMDAGKIAQVAKPHEIYRNPRNAHVAEFIGETNLLKIRVTREDGDFAAAEFPDGTEITGRFSDGSWRAETVAEVLASIRPEAWRIVTEKCEEQSNVLAGRISDRAYLGGTVQYWIDSAVGKIQVIEMNPHKIHEPGREVILHVRPEDVVFLGS